MREFMVMLGAIFVCVLWRRFLAPLAVNAFGVPARISPWRIDRGNQHLTATQYFWSIGMLGVGVGVLLLCATGPLARAVQLPRDSSWHGCWPCSSLALSLDLRAPCAALPGRQMARSSRKSRDEWGIPLPFCEARAIATSVSGPPAYFGVVAMTLRSLRFRRWYESSAACRHHSHARAGCVPSCAPC